MAFLSKTPYYILLVLGSVGLLFFLQFTTASAQSGSRCNTYNAGDTPPAGYGAAWDVLSSARMHMLHSYCRNDGSFNFTVGHPDAPDTWYVYKQGYYYSGSWKPFTLSGEFADGSTDWLLREGYLSLATPPQRPFYWVGYVCSWTGSEWKCGCRDQACTQNYWQLQQATASGGSGGGSAAGDDTFACSNSYGVNYNGPTVSLKRNWGYTQYRDGDFAAQTTFDARGAIWMQEVTPDKRSELPIILGKNFPDPPYCWLGGVIHGTNNPNATWNQSYVGHPTGLQAWSRNHVITGLRIHNVFDGIGVHAQEVNDGSAWTFKNSWVSYNRDDTIENDGLMGGVAEDNLIDGTYVFYSARNSGSRPDGSNNTVLIRNNLVRMQGLPGPDAPGKGSYPSSEKGYGGILKIEVDAPKMEFHNNVFYLEDVEHMRGGFIGDSRQSLVKACSNNLVVWTGSGAWPGSAWADLNSKFPGCFKAVKDIHAWNKIKQNWIDCHPLVPRISGDPQSNPSNCQAHAYGGGQGGTAIPN